MISIKISEQPLDASLCIAEAKDDEYGGMSIFIGQVRNKTKGKPVVRLQYECYQSMAEKEMKKIADQAFRQWSIGNILIHHRTGTLHVGDIAVIIIVSAMHRAAAFDACRYVIDTLKETVPIWKKEIFEDGEEWVSAHA